jgi:hypothetical protein
MKIHKMPQHIIESGQLIANPEWLAIRQGKITASGLGDWIAEPYAIKLTKDEICAELAAHGISGKTTWKRDDLLALLPNPEQYRKLCPPAQLLIDTVLGEQADEERPPDFGTFWTRRGNRLESVARGEYEKMSGWMTTEVGFVEREDIPLGFSPDGVIPFDTEFERYVLLEIKCHEGKTHRAMLRDGILPEQHRNQVHAQLAISGAEWCDFFAYHPNIPPLLVRVYPDEYTEAVKAGLELVAVELVKQRREAAEEYNNWKP